MFCQKCGTQNPDDGKFCSKCGNDLKSTIQAERKGISGKLGKWGIPGSLVLRIQNTWYQAGYGKMSFQGSMSHARSLRQRG